VTLAVGSAEAGHVARRCAAVHGVTVALHRERRGGGGESDAYVNVGSGFDGEGRPARVRGGGRRGDNSRPSSRAVWASLAAGARRGRTGHGANRGRRDHCRPDAHGTLTGLERQIGTTRPEAPPGPPKPFIDFLREEPLDHRRERRRTSGIGHSSMCAGVVKLIGRIERSPTRVGGEDRRRCGRGRQVSRP